MDREGMTMIMVPMGMVGLVLQLPLIKEADLDLSAGPSAVGSRMGFKSQRILSKNGSRLLARTSPLNSLATINMMIKIINTIEDMRREDTQLITDRA
jgi:hypothetical protein